jgi:hypothetical protein
MAERLAASSSLHALKELALALGVVRAPASGKRHTRLDIALAIWARAAELRGIVAECQKLRVELSKTEESLSEVKDELDELKEQQLIQLADNDDKSHGDLEDTRDDPGSNDPGSSSGLVLGERDDREWGIYEDEVIQLEVRSLWGEPEDIVVLPSDEIRSQKIRIGSLFNLDDESAFELELFAMHGEMKHTRMGNMETFGQYFTPGSQGVVLIGVSMRGGGYEQKRRRNDVEMPRRDDGNVSMTSEAPSSLQTLDDKDDDEDESEVSEKSVAVLKSTFAELKSAVRGQKEVLEQNRLQATATSLDVLMVQFEANRYTFFKFLLDGLSIEQCKSMMQCKSLDTKNPRQAVSAMTRNFIFYEECKALNAGTMVINNMTMCLKLLVRLGYTAAYDIGNGRLNHQQFKRDLLEVIESKAKQSVQPVQPAQTPRRRGFFG